MLVSLSRFRSLALSLSCACSLSFALRDSSRALICSHTYALPFSRVGGVSAQGASSFILSFEKNFAGGAGGATYSTCFSLGVCEGVIKNTLGLPTPGGEEGKIMSFLNNLAGGYGKDIATAPGELVLNEFAEHTTAYVLGKNSLDLSFSMRDAQGEPIVGSDDVKISHLVYMYVCINV